MNFRLEILNSCSFLEFTPLDVPRIQFPISSSGIVNRETRENVGKRLFKQHPFNELSWKFRHANCDNILPDRVFDPSTCFPTRLRISLSNLYLLEIRNSLGSRNKLMRANFVDRLNTREFRLRASVEGQASSWRFFDILLFLQIVQFFFRLIAIIKFLPSVY